MQWQNNGLKFYKESKMGIHSFKNGNKIKYDPELEDWFYLDGELADKIRICPKCHKMPENGRDACLGELPGVESACCGHGVRPGYIKFENNLIIRFDLLDIEKQYE